MSIEDIVRVFLAVTGTLVACVAYAVPATLLVISNLWMIVPVVAAMPVFALAVVLSLKGLVE